MLINNIAEVQKYLVVGAGTSLDKLTPHFRNAESAFIKPLLHANMYDELEEFYEANPSGELNDAQEATQKLLQIVQNAVVHLGYWLGFHALNSTISDGGFKRTETEKVKGLYKYQENELKEYFKTSGFNAMDEALLFMEENIQHFSEFKATENWTELKEAFIPNTKTFEKVPYSINNSRLTFLRLKPHMAKVEDFDIKPLLGDTVFAEIKAEMVKDSPADKVKKVLPIIQKAVAYLSTAQLMEESGAELGDKGLFFESLSAQGASNLNRQPATEARISALINRNRETGKGYLNMLKNHLLKETESWPDFSAVSGSALNRDNTDKKTFWA